MIWLRPPCGPCEVDGVARLDQEKAGETWSSRHKISPQGGRMTPSISTRRTFGIWPVRSCCNRIWARRCHSHLVLSPDGVALSLPGD